MIKQKNPVFCGDNTFTNASVEDQTRSMVSHEKQCEKGHTNDTVRKDSWTEIQKTDSSIGRTSSRSLSRSECQPTYAAMGNRPLAGTRDTLSDEQS